jgi:hypothetical protein
MDGCKSHLGGPRACQRGSRVYQDCRPTQNKGQISPEAVALFERYFDQVSMPMVRVVFEGFFEDGYEPSPVFARLAVSYGPSLGAFNNHFDSWCSPLMTAATSEGWKSKGGTPLWDGDTKYAVIVMCSVAFTNSVSTRPRAGDR